MVRLERMPPSPRQNVIKCRNGEAKRTVAKFIQSILDDSCQVLVSAQVKVDLITDKSQHAIPAALRPAVRIHVACQLIARYIFTRLRHSELGCDVVVHRSFRQRLQAAERCSGNKNHEPRLFCAGVGPCFQEFHLPLTQQPCFKRFHLRSIIFWILNEPIEGSRLGWKDVLGSRLELAVFNNSETDAAVFPSGVKYSDALLYRLRVEWIGHVARLCDLRHIYPTGRHLITAAVLSLIIGTCSDSSPASTTPDIAMVHIMIVRECDHWHAPEQVAIAPSELVPLSQVIERRLFKRICLHTKATIRFIKLVAKEKYHIRFMLQGVLNDFCIRKA